MDDEDEELNVDDDVEEEEEEEEVETSEVVDAWAACKSLAPLGVQDELDEPTVYPMKNPG